MAQVVIHGTTGSTSYETIPPLVRLESSGGVLSTVDMVVQRRDDPRRLRDHDDEWHSLGLGAVEITLSIYLIYKSPQMPIIGSLRGEVNSTLFTRVQQ